MDHGNSYKATVMKFNGTTWALVGTAGFSADAADYISLALDSSNVPYAAYMDYGNGYKATVMKYQALTPIELMFFKAEYCKDHVAITWETATEIANAGFHIWRSECEHTGQVPLPGTYTQITGLLIPAQGGASWGAKYSFTDFSIEPGKTYWYKLEDISTQGVIIFHEPVKIETSK